MAKKPRVRTLMDSQHVKGCETLLKSARQNFLSNSLIIQKENQNLEIKKYFLNFFHFQNVHKIWNTLKKKMSLRSYLFLKLKTAKRQVA